MSRPPRPSGNSGPFGPTEVRRRWARLALSLCALVGVTAATLVAVTAGPVGACDEPITGVFADGTEWRYNEGREEIAPADVVGAFRREVTSTVGPGGGRTGASVLSVVEQWGEVPTDVQPVAIGNHHADSLCAGEAPEIGYSVYYAVIQGDDEEQEVRTPDDVEIESVLASLLGQSTTVDIDARAEADLVRSIEQTRPRSWRTPVVAGVGLVAAIGAAILARRRHHRNRHRRSPA